MGSNPTLPFFWVNAMTVHFYRYRFPGIAQAGVVFKRIHYCKIGKRISQIGVIVEDTKAGISFLPVIGRGDDDHGYSTAPACACPTLTGIPFNHTANVIIGSTVDIRDASTKEWIGIEYIASGQAAEGGWMRMVIVECDD